MLVNTSYTVVKAVFLLAKDILKEYIYDITIRNYTTRTNNLLRFLKYCEAELKVLELEDISHLHIKKYLNCLKDRDLSLAI